MSTFKTIDELIEHHRKLLGSLDTSVAFRSTDNNVCSYITKYHASNIMETLMLKTNIPSKYDLLIIDHILKNIDSEGEIYKNLYNRILCMYRDRK